mmetsp:Transcript_5506/g.8559  ORF Transcript_5506/g.8559 Transcript_5506/m.8559 type:complete len:568 (-) Transcript_5506:164-1867(-)
MLACGPLCNSPPDSHNEASIDGVLLEETSSIRHFRETMIAKFGDLQTQLLQMQASLLKELDQAVGQGDVQYRSGEAEAKTWSMLDQRVQGKSRSMKVPERSDWSSDYVSAASVATASCTVPQRNRSDDFVRLSPTSRSTFGKTVSLASHSPQHTTSGNSLKRPQLTHNSLTSNLDFEAQELEEAPQCAFVINVRRLIEVQEFLALLHELLKSTAIAALTLVAAASTFQFFSTLVFITIVLIVYSMHEADWDRMDVEDLRMLVHLISDDCDPVLQISNPNRIFKALSNASNPFWKWISRLTRLGFLFLSIVGWLSLEAYWTSGDMEEDSEGRRLRDGFDALLIDSHIASVEDAETLGMQLIVGSMMLLLQALFKYLLLRETNATMPLTSFGETWDPRRNGTPLSYWFGGMPSMWFTRKEVMQKLKHYIDMANPGKKNGNFHPQELAYYALSGDEERCELQTALGEAKLFDAYTQSLVLEGDNLPQPLEIDLVFFDSKRQHKSFPYSGQFQYFNMDPSNTDANLYGNRRMVISQTPSKMVSRGTFQQKATVFHRGLTNLFSSSSTQSRN